MSALTIFGQNSPSDVVRPKTVQHLSKQSASHTVCQYMGEWVIQLVHPLLCFLHLGLDQFTVSRPDHGLTQQVTHSQMALLQSFQSLEDHTGDDPARIRKHLCILHQVWGANVDLEHFPLELQRNRSLASSLVMAMKMRMEAMRIQSVIVMPRTDQ